MCWLGISALIINILFLNCSTNYLQNGLFLLLLLVSLTKFIKSLGLHVNVYIFYYILGYNKRRYSEKKKKKKRAAASLEQYQDCDTIGMAYFEGAEISKQSCAFPEYSLLPAGFVPGSPHFHLQMAGDTGGVKDKLNIVFF